jgi:hypothetical protein
MKAEIKYLHCPDIDDLEHYSPPAPDEFSFLLQIIAGPEGQEGEESFDAIVCSPMWLSRNLVGDKVMAGRHHLIMNSYSYVTLYSFLRGELEKCEGKDWNEVASKLSRIGRWEFEDYVPSPK